MPNYTMAIHHRPFAQRNQIGFVQFLSRVHVNRHDMVRHNLFSPSADSAALALKESLGERSPFGVAFRAWLAWDAHGLSLTFKSSE